MEQSSLSEYLCLVRGQTTVEIQAQMQRWLEVSARMMIMVDFVDISRMSFDNAITQINAKIAKSLTKRVLIESINSIADNQDDALQLALRILGMGIDIWVLSYAKPWDMLFIPIEKIDIFWMIDETTKPYADTTNADDLILLAEFRDEIHLSYVEDCLAYLEDSILTLTRNQSSELIAIDIRRIALLVKSLQFDF